MRQQKEHRQVGVSLPFQKSRQGQKIKKRNKKICTVLFNKVMKYRTSWLTQSCMCVYHRVCVCVCVCASTKLTTWLLKVWVLLLSLLVFIPVSLVSSLVLRIWGFFYDVPLSMTKVSSSLGGRHTQLQPVKLSITMTASPASLTDLLSSSYTGWLWSDFLSLWSSLIWIWEVWKGFLFFLFYLFFK